MITFTFRGWVDGAQITEATDPNTGNKIDVSEMSEKELVSKLNSGELCISLGDHLYSSRDAEIEIEDFAVEDN